jgi:hypothetical protein
MRDITRNNKFYARYAQGATREGNGSLDLDNLTILEGRRGSHSVVYHDSDSLIQGELQDQRPQQLECVFLKELTSKVISSIVSTRILAVLAGNNAEEQFTTIGCQKVMQCLRSALSIRR